jgi:hypothetical protein
MPTRTPRPIDSTLHGVIDYQMAALLLTALPRLVGVEGTGAARQIRIAGLLHGGYSSVTRYPLGIVKALPYKAHLVLDGVGALSLAAAPFLTGRYKRGPRQWLPQVGLGLLELSALLLTDPTGRGDYHGDVATVQAANTESPDEKIHTGGPAVRRRVA